MGSAMPAFRLVTADPRPRRTTVAQTVSTDQRCNQGVARVSVMENSWRAAWRKPAGELTGGVSPRRSPVSLVRVRRRRRAGPGRLGLRQVILVAFRRAV